MLKKVLLILIACSMVLLMCSCNQINGTNGEITLATIDNETLATEETTGIVTTNEEVIIPVETTVYIPSKDDKNVERYAMKAEVYADEKEEESIGVIPYVFVAVMHDYDEKTNSFIDISGLANEYLKNDDRTYLLDKDNELSAINFAPMINAESKIIVEYDDKSVIGLLRAYDENGNEVLSTNVKDSTYDISSLESGKTYVITIEFAHKSITVYVVDVSKINTNIDIILVFC